VRISVLTMLLLCSFYVNGLQAQQASLVTYGPGAEVWELFGHNALWIEDEDSGLNHTFSFGYFELDRPGFHRDFAEGIMLYFGAASYSDDEFARYRLHDRSIRIQRLDLTPTQVRELYRLLHEAIFPQPQYYQYDYYRANCSTWLRDLLDQVLDGALAEQLQSEPARHNFRDHTRRMTRERFWIHTGIMLTLGPAIDRPRNAWEEGFLPDRLADWLVDMEIDGKPLVISDEVIYVSRNHDLAEKISGPRLGYAGLGLLSLILILWPAMKGQGTVSRIPWNIGLVAAGLGGSVLLFMWLRTGHEDTWNNAMLLLLNPLWLVFLLPGLAYFKRLCWWLLAAGVASGSLLISWPDGPQFRFDQLLWITPLCLALLIVARKS
jgi:hypothetical protein